MPIVRRTSCTVACFPLTTVRVDLYVIPRFGVLPGHEHKACKSLTLSIIGHVCGRGFRRRRWGRVAAVLTLLCFQSSLTQISSILPRHRLPHPPHPAMFSCTPASRTSHGTASPSTEPFQISASCPTRSPSSMPSTRSGATSPPRSTYGPTTTQRHHLRRMRRSHPATRAADPSTRGRRRRAWTG